MEGDIKLGLLDGAIIAIKVLHYLISLMDLFELAFSQFLMTFHFLAVYLWSDDYP